MIPSAETLQVMLIDDSDIDLLLNQKIIKLNKITENIIAFNTAQKAFEYLSVNPNKIPDVILVDIQMPEVNGFDFLDLIRSDENILRHAKVFMLSSTIHDRDILRAEKDPIVISILNKPLNGVVLKQWLDKIYVD